MVRKPLAGALVAVIFAAGALVARAQEPKPDAAQIKKEILDKVRARLEEEHKKIMERIEKVIDEELAKAFGGVAPAAVEDQKRLEELTAERDELAKKIEAEQDAEARKELQKRLATLEDRRDEIGKKVRAAKRQAEDAAVQKEAQNIPEDQEIVNEIFGQHIKEHEAKQFDKSIPGFKKIYYRFSDQRIGATSAYNVACGYALSGDKDQAMDWLEIAIEAGWNEETDFDHMRKDPDMDVLRKERRFQKIMLDR